METDHLEIPEESSELKRSILKVRAMMGSESFIDWDSMTVWYGNQIQSYLWNHWKKTLRSKGFSWQDFLKIMKYRTDDAVLWINGKISWEDFVRKVIETLQGPLVDVIKRR